MPEQVKFAKLILWAHDYVNNYRLQNGLAPIIFKEDKELDMDTITDTIVGKKVCECGCGTEIKLNKRFVLGHHKRLHNKFVGNSSKHERTPKVKHEVLNIEDLKQKSFKEGWDSAIASIRSSVETYPNGGGDIQIMSLIDKMLSKYQNKLHMIKLLMEL